MNRTLAEHVGLPERLALAADGAVLGWLNELSQKPSRERFDILSRLEEGPGSSEYKKRFAEELDNARAFAFKSEAGKVKNFVAGGGKDPVLSELLRKWDQAVEIEAFRRAVSGELQVGGWDASFRDFIASDARFGKALATIQPTIIDTNRNPRHQTSQTFADTNSNPLSRNNGIISETSETFPMIVYCREILSNRPIWGPRTIRDQAELAAAEIECRSTVRFRR